MTADARPGLDLLGSLSLSVGGHELGGAARFALLRHIDRLGSITAAARAAGLSYRAAWQAVETMNGLAAMALVERVSGGPGGGGTRLTAHGRDLLDRYERLSTLHANWLRRLADDGLAGQPLSELMELMTMKTSARNQYAGTVTGLGRGAVNDEVELTLAGGLKLVAIITHESAETLSLKQGARAFALIKASSVMLATDMQGARLSARNQLHGTVTRVVRGAVNSEVVVDVGGGLSVAAIVTNGSAETLALEPGAAATAFFKASSVIVGVQD